MAHNCENPILKYLLTDHPRRMHTISRFEVFSRSPYALFVHGFFDMKTRLNPPYTRSKPHFPPIKALEEWSKAKGISPYVVQQAIGKKGTPLVPFFKIGIKKSEPDRKLLLAKAGLQITATWNAGRILPKR